MGYSEEARLAGQAEKALSNLRDIMPPTDRKKSTPQVPAYTGKLTTEPQYLETVLSILNERWRLEQVYDSSGKIKRILHTKDDSSFKAVTSLDIDAVEEANIELILAKHKARIEKAVANK